MRSGEVRDCEVGQSVGRSVSQVASESVSQLATPPHCHQILPGLLRSKGQTRNTDTWAKRVLD